MIALVVMANMSEIEAGVIRSVRKERTLLSRSSPDPSRRAGRHLRAEPDSPLCPIQMSWIPGTNSASGFSSAPIRCNENILEDLTDEKN